MKHKKQLDTCIASLTIAVCLCLSVLVLRQSRLLYKATDSPSFKKRHPRFVIAFYLLVLLHLVVDVPIKCALVILNRDNLEHKWTLFSFVNYMHDVSILAVIFLFLCRFWLLYYDFRYNDTFANLAWRLEIQPTYTDTNWWLLKRSTYGNAKHCATLCVAAWVLGSAVYLSVALTDQIPVRLGAVIVFTVFVIPICAAFATLVHYVRPIADAYNIKKELTLCCKVLFLTFAIYFVIMVVGRVKRLKTNNKALPLYTVISSLATAFAQTAIAYINSYYILVAPYKKDKIDDEMLLQSEELPLEEILSERSSFESFMKHLVAEFSVENLLFLCEVQQFRRTLNYPRSEVEPVEVPEIYLKWMPLCAYIRHSDAWLGVSYLYYKYINKDAPHQINISAITYKKLTAYFPKSLEEWIISQHLNDTEAGRLIPRLPKSYKSASSSLTFNTPIPGSFSKSIPRMSRMLSSRFGRRRESSTLTADKSPKGPSPLKAGTCLFGYMFPRKFVKATVHSDDYYRTCSSVCESESGSGGVVTSERFQLPLTELSSASASTMSTDSRTVTTQLSQTATATARLIAQHFNDTKKQLSLTGLSTVTDTLVKGVDRLRGVSVTENVEVLEPSVFAEGTALYCLVKSVRQCTQKRADVCGPPYTRETMRLMKQSGHTVEHFARGQRTATARPLSMLEMLDMETINEDDDSAIASDRLKMSVGFGSSDPIRIPISKKGKTKKKFLGDDVKEDSRVLIEPRVSVQERNFLAALQHGADSEHMGGSMDLDAAVDSISEDRHFDKCVLFHMFDRPEREIWRLMNDSLMRYQLTHTYEQLVVQRSYAKRKTGAGPSSTGSHKSTNMFTSFFGGLKETLTSPRIRDNELQESLLADSPSVNS